MQVVNSSCDHSRVDLNVPEIGQDRGVGTQRLSYELQIPRDRDSLMPKRRGTDHGGREGNSLQIFGGQACGDNESKGRSVPPGRQRRFRARRTVRTPEIVPQVRPSATMPIQA